MSERTRTDTTTRFDATATTDAAALRALLTETASSSKTPGLQFALVDRDGVVFEHHHGFADVASRRPMQADTTLMAYSMSKTLTAAAVLQLVDAKVIRLDDSVSRFIPWQPYGNAITVRQLLSHTAGIPNPAPLRWVHLVEDDETFDEQGALDAVLRVHGRLAAPPSTRYAYSNIGYWLLGPLVTCATGQHFTSYVVNHVIAPLGIRRDELSYRVADANRHASGYLEKYSLMNVFKRLLVGAEYIGRYEGRWLRIRDHYVNGPAFGGLVGTASGFAKFLQDQLRDHSLLFGDDTRSLFYEQQFTQHALVPMTLGWHLAGLGATTCHYKEGGGGGFHCLMRLYPGASLGMVAMSNATAFDVTRLLDAVAGLVVKRV